MIIGLFGLSGSGKTYVRKQFEEAHEDFKCFSASELLTEANRPIAKRSLDQRTLDLNQLTLIEILKEKAKRNNIFIELHALIEKNDNRPYLVDKQVLLSLSLDYCFLLEISPKKLLNQRKFDFTKNRNLLSSAELYQLSLYQRNHLLEIFKSKLIVVKDYCELESKLNFPNR